MKAAIVMLTRGDDDILRVTDGNGTEHAIESDDQLHDVLDRILDDPDLPEPQKVERLQHAAEQIIAEGMGTFLPAVAKPLAAPLVRDLGTLVQRYRETAAARKAERASIRRNAPNRKDGARSARITKSKVRLGANVKRRRGAA